MAAPQTDFERDQVEAAQAAVDCHTQALRLEEGNDASVDLYHLIRSLLTWSDAWNVDFDEALSLVRADIAAGL